MSEEGEENRIQADFESTLPLFGDIDGKSGAAFLTDLFKLLPKKPASIAVLIRSNGGCIDWGTAIVEGIRIARERYQTKIGVIGLSQVASMAATIWLSVPVQDRMLTKKSRLLFHRARTNFSGDLRQRSSNMGEELREMMGFVAMHQKFDTELEEQLVFETKKKRSEIKRRVSDGWFISATEAKALGLVGTII